MKLCLNQLTSQIWSRSIVLYIIRLLVSMLGFLTHVVWNRSSVVKFRVSCVLQTLRLLAVQTILFPTGISPNPDSCSWHCASMIPMFLIFSNMNIFFTETPVGGTLNITAIRFGKNVLIQNDILVTNLVGRMCNSVVPCEELTLVRPKPRMWYDTKRQKIRKFNCTNPGIRLEGP